MIGAFLSLGALAQAPADETSADEVPPEEQLPEELPEELPGDVPLREPSATVQEATPISPVEGSVSLLGGPSGWHRVSSMWTVLGLVHVDDALAVSFHATANHVLVTRPRAAGPIAALLPEIGVGIALDRPGTGPWRPQVGAEATLTLWKLDPITGAPGLAPGLQARAGITRLIRDPITITFDGLLGFRAAPGLSRDVNATWSDVAAVGALRAGVGMQW